MNYFFLTLVLVFLSVIGLEAVNITEIEDKIRNQRKTLEDTAKKLQESSRQQRLKHDEHLKASRDRIEKIKSEAAQRARATPARSTEKTTEEAAADPASKVEKERSPEVTEAHKKLDDFIENSAKVKAGEELKKGGKNLASSTLALHGVDDSLIEELHRMSTSSITREAMIQHVSQHFPEKKPDEWNEIVLSALAVKGKSPPDVSATDHALKNEARLKQLKFERSKASAEAKTKQEDL